MNRGIVQSAIFRHFGTSAKFRSFRPLPCLRPISAPLPPTARARPRNRPATQHRRAALLGPANVHAAEGAGIPRGTVFLLRRQGPPAVHGPGSRRLDRAPARTPGSPPAPTATSPPTCAAGGAITTAPRGCPPNSWRSTNAPRSSATPPGPRRGGGRIFPTSRRTWKRSSRSPAVSPTCGVTRRRPTTRCSKASSPARARAELDTLFATLRPAIVELLGPAAERSARVPGDLLAGHYPVAAQAAFNREVAGALGSISRRGRSTRPRTRFATASRPATAG